ncbi:hydantoinase/carbamoylase family amidase [Halorubrum aidingense JCM 13560]|uniref:Hydantoinase/carbamoylase family amidase n=1 Tax=Halorubrum aidingense JCM 13560 TaxID=1230454 RepID=M0PCA8_9EURY|nr:Zn-dependent hydrolase [Halorubrum aidingense]EMA67661.1 hydantoinase/carbamoylase family amidase [Halorubrum aidingense JCM 13560]
MDTVSTTRLRTDIEANAEFGRVDVDDGRGRTVLAGTDANRDARDYFVTRLQAADMDVTIDAVGNVVGRWVPASADPDAAPIASGSHLDSVPHGGIFDGPLGVYAALEAVRALQDAAVELARPVHVVCFTEEEGQRFGNGLVGSSVATGRSSVAETLSYTDESGVTFEEEFERIGYRGTGSIDASEWSAWIELHVEQGTRLEDAGAAVGIVSDIAGITHCYADVIGHADHAGSTPMADRTDALAAASELVLDVESDARRSVTDGSQTAVGTVGSLDVSPNATNVIPGDARLGIDIRDVDDASIESLVSDLEASARRIEADRDVEVRIERPYMVPPAPMAERCRSGLRTAAETADIPALELHSGAAHDTMNVARVTDAGLLFAPSADGISHNPLEWTDWSDCAAATAVLAGAIKNIET